MKDNTKKLVLTALLIAVAVVGSSISFPVFGSKVTPIQHMVNILSAVFLGPFYAVLGAFLASLIRNLTALGTLLAFPGSMIGAFLSAIVYKKMRNLKLTLIAELIGTGILGGLLAYPIAVLFMGKTAGELAFYVYVIPFFISTAVGVLLAGVLLGMLDRSGVIEKIQKRL